MSHDEAGPSRASATPLAAPAAAGPAAAGPGTVWIDGRLLPADGAHVSVFDRGFQLGDGISRPSVPAVAG